MINQPETYDEENARFDWAQDRKEARHNLLTRVVQLIWLGIAAFCIVAFLKNAELIGRSILHAVW